MNNGIYITYPRSVKEDVYCFKLNSDDLPNSKLFDSFLKTKGIKYKKTMQYSQTKAMHWAVYRIPTTDLITRFQQNKDYAENLVSEFTNKSNLSEGKIKKAIRLIESITNKKLILEEMTYNKYNYDPQWDDEDINSEDLGDEEVLKELENFFLNEGFKIHKFEEGGELCADLEKETDLGINVLIPIIPFTSDGYVKAVRKFDIETEVEVARSVNAHAKVFSLEETTSDIEDFNYNLEELIDILPK